MCVEVLILEKLHPGLESYSSAAFLELSGWLSHIPVYQKTGSHSVDVFVLSSLLLCLLRAPNFFTSTKLSLSSCRDALWRRRWTHICTTP